MNAAAPTQTDAAPGALSDDELVARCRSGKLASPAFDELYRRHAPAVLAFLCGLHRGDEQGAREALQETFVRCYTALPSFEPGRQLRPWLYRIARNLTLDRWKRGARERLLEPEVVGELAGSEPRPGPVEVAARREGAALLRGAVDELPAAERAVFLLRHDQGLSYAEVADALSCSVRTAKYRMKAALERLGREAERLGVTP
ncbi:MAG: RNA polymerase sigma factor [Planctomycetota bacterium]